MARNKQLAIAAGAVVVVGAAAVGGYYMWGRDGVEAPTDAAPSASEAAAAAPARATQLTAVVPASVDLYIELVNVRDFAEATTDMEVMNVTVIGLLETLGQAGALLGESFGIGADDGESFLSSMRSVAFAGELGATPHLGALLVSSKPAAVEKLLASPRFTKEGKLGEIDKYQVSAEYGPEPKEVKARALHGAKTFKGMAVVWFADRGMLAVGTDGFLERVAAVMAGKEPALASAEKYKEAVAKLPPKAHATFYAPADALTELLEKRGDKQLIADYFQDQGPIVGGIYIDKPGMRLTVQGGLGGGKVPMVRVPAASKGLSLAGELPGDTLGYVAFASSLGKGADIEKALGEGARDELEEMKSALGIGLADVLDALGDQGAVGVVPKSGNLPLDELAKLDPIADVAVIGIQRVTDIAVAKRFVDGLKKAAPKSMTDHYDIQPTADGGIEAKPRRSHDPWMTVRFGKDVIRYAVGQDALVRGALTAMDGGKTLDKDEAHKLAMKGLPGGQHATMWLDTARLLRGPSQPSDPDPLGLSAMLGYYKLTGDKRITTAASLEVSERVTGYGYRVEMLNALGVLPIIGIYGVRRYLASAKTAEAKNNVGAIARGATAAYERESAAGGHVLCKSAAAVPSSVPAGVKYQPDTAEGKDFETGDETGGWKCLRFSMTQPQYYQYAYSAGGPYKGPARGGPDPGPNGFEVSAEGDLDGDGKTSLFTITGVVDPATQKLKRSTEIYIVDEQE